MRKELLRASQEVVLDVLLATSYAFTLKQKRALDERDKGKCQAPFKHDCNEKVSRHRHHILPQGYCLRFGVEPDFATNGIVLCENAHIKVLHPDADKAKKDYVKGDKQSFSKLRKEREDKLAERVPYWNSGHDRALYTIAVRNSQKMDKKKPDWWPFGKNHGQSDSGAK